MSTGLEPQSKGEKALGPTQDVNLDQHIYTYDIDEHLESGLDRPPTRRDKLDYVLVLLEMLLDSAPAIISIILAIIFLLIVMFMLLAALNPFHFVDEKLQDKAIGLIVSVPLSLLAYFSGYANGNKAGDRA